MRQGLSKGARDLLNHYFAIQVGDWKVRCPYFMNVRGLHNLPVAYSGKGLPREIEYAANKIFKKKVGSNKTIEDAKDFLVLSGLGIDCSGLVVNILNTHLQETINKSIYQIIKQSGLYRKLLTIFRPRTNISANLLTGSLNAREIKIGDVKPGDLIRQGRHVMLIEWVEFRGKTVNRIGYVESNTRPEWGVQKGEITIQDINKSLEYQNWSVEVAKARYKLSENRAVVTLKNL